MNDMRPLNHSLKMNNTFIYKLPRYTDREFNPVFLIMDCLPPVNDWAWLTTDDSIFFNPNKWIYLGHYNCKLTLTDTRNSTIYNFYIDVLNFPPVFMNGAKPQNVKMRLN
jgi:hypothetical protein